MQHSLNHIVEDLAFKLGEQFNYTLRESLKYTVDIYREKLLREEDFNNGININDFRQSIIIPLIPYETDLNYETLITKDDVPKPIRFKTRGRNRFSFVGNKLGNKAFTQTTLIEYDFIKNLKFQTDTVYYAIENNKFIIIDNNKFCSVRVDGIFANPRILQNICENVEEVDDNAPYPISGDLLAIITSGVLNGTFPIRQVPEKDIIRSNTENQQ